jgi:hypothetical protein
LSLDPKHMLGVEKIRKSVNGVHSIQLTQPGFIDNLWDKFGGYRGKMSAPEGGGRRSRDGWLAVMM